MRRDLIGETLNQQFRVETFIASGGMATIYRVWDLQRSVPLAMKVLQPELAEDPAFIARFQREANSLQRLVHPHIVPFYGLYRADDLTFLLERYIDGPSLDEVLRANAGRPLPLGEALVYFKALYTSLGYAHAQGIIHCDIKPGNVLIDQGGHVYLTDFGIARYMDAATTTSSTMGTPLYMAPEQIRGERVSPQTDIYALGVLMFELLTGQRPFRGDAGVPEGVGPNLSDRIRYQHIYLPPPDPRAINPDIPPGVSAVILKALAKDPVGRYPSVQAMAEALSQAVAARFESIPDRVSLPAKVDRRRPAPSDYGGTGTLPAAPQGYRPAPPVSMPETRPGAIPQAAAPRPKRRGWLWLVGLLVLLALCIGLGSALAQRIRLPGSITLPPAATRVPDQQTNPPTPGGPTGPIGSTEPAGAASPTPAQQTNPPPSGAQGDFPVAGEIAILRYSEGAPRLFLLDAASGQAADLPGVPGVNQRDVNAPQWSPDGQRLVWTGQYKGRMHVIVMDMTEREPYQLPAGEAYSRVSAPAFLPGGQRVSFWASDGASGVLVIADAVTGEAVDTISLPEYRNMFVWNWQNQALAFVFQGANGYKVALGDAPGGSGRLLDTGGEGYAPAWSNDGQWIAFQSDKDRDPGMNEIWVARADGSELHAVTATPAGKWSRAPSWSPDGRMIAFVSNQEASRGNDYGELYVVSLDSGQVRKMTDTGGGIYDWRPAWRP